MNSKGTRTLACIAMATIMGTSMMSVSSAAPDIALESVLGNRLVTGLTLNSSGQAETVQELYDALGSSSGEIRVTTADGMEVARDDACATGMQVRVDGEEPATIVVAGDVLGVGKMSMSQLTRMAGAFQGTDSLEGAFLAAADFNGTGAIELADLVRQGELYRKTMASQTGGTGESDVSGAWQVPESPVLTEEMLTAFSSALEGLEGVSYTPIACAGEQVVAGMNYRFLCAATPVIPDPETTYAILTVYAPLDSDAELIDVMSFDVPAPRPESMEEGLPGGWLIPESPVLTEEMRASFDSALNGLVGVAYEPIACVGQQVVAGMNYRFLCTATPATLQPETTYAILTVYVPLDGDAELTDIATDDASVSEQAPSGEQPEDDPAAEDDPTAEDESLAGGWSIPESPVLTEEMHAAFDSAMDGLAGAAYTPIVCVGEQVVAGTNYRFLCTATPATLDPETTYAIVTVYAPFDGDAELTDVVSFDVEAPSQESMEEGASGGWFIPESPALTEEMRAAFDSALDGLVGVTYNPVACVGEQVVAGMNYRFLCTATPVTLNSETTYAILTVYAPIEGEAQLTSIDMCGENA